MAQTYQFHYLEPKVRRIQARDMTDAQKQARMIVADVNDRAKAAGAEPCVLTRIVSIDTDVIAPVPEKSPQRAAEDVYDDPSPSVA